ncbi:hypothetical protein BJX99DRAFT_252866 [Aspergillus californicus]
MENHIPKLELYIGMTDHNFGPNHWILMVRSQGADTYTMVDVEGGYPPSTYKLRIEREHRFESRNIVNRHMLSTTAPFAELDIFVAARSVPAQHCQRFVLAVVRKLEKKTIVAGGTADGFTGCLQPGAFEGPVRIITEREYLRIERLFGYRGAINELSIIQGYVPPNKAILETESVSDEPIVEL